VKREPFAGTGPWWLKMRGAHAYVQRPTTIQHFSIKTALALDRERGVKLGCPALMSRIGLETQHQRGRGRVQVRGGKAALYRDPSPIWSVRRRVYAYELDEGLEAGCSENMRDAPQVELRTASGIRRIPLADLLYVACAAQQRAVVDDCAQRRLVPLARRGLGVVADHAPGPGTRGRRTRSLLAAAFIGSWVLKTEVGRRLTEAVFQGLG